MPGRSLRTVLQAGAAGVTGLGLAPPQPQHPGGPACPPPSRGPPHSPRAHGQSTSLVPARARRPPAQRTHPEPPSWRGRKNLSSGGPSARAQATGMLPTPQRLSSPSPPPKRLLCTQPKGHTAHRGPAAPRTTHKAWPRHEDQDQHHAPLSGPSLQEITDYTTAFRLLPGTEAPSKSVPYFVFIKHILNHDPSGSFGLTTLPEAANWLTFLPPCDLSPLPPPPATEPFRRSVNLSSFCVLATHPG